MVQYLIYGDGLGAQIQDKRVFIDKEKGMECIEYVLLPTFELAEKYKLFPKLDKDGFIKVTHPTVYRAVLSDSPRLGREVIFKNFLNGDTPFSNLNAKYQEQILGMQKVISTLRNQNAWLHARMRSMSNQMHEFIRKDVEMLKPVLQLRRRIDDEEEREKYPVKRERE